MKEFLKNHYKLLLFFVIVGLAGGYFVTLYSVEILPEEMLREATSQGITQNMLAVIGGFQSAAYGLLLGAIGILLAKKIGLWQEKLTFSGKPLVWAVVVSVLGGLGMILPDLWFFGNYSQVLRDQFAVKPTITYLLATVTYGAVIEEVMLRLFMMSLLAFLLHKLFEKEKQETSAGILIAANVISALVFAAGHLPMTFLTIGSTPVIILRCFLLNGGLGMAFGWLYRKYGLQYAMLAHGGCHMISKLIWILFL